MEKVEYLQMLSGFSGNFSVTPCVSFAFQAVELKIWAKRKVLMVSFSLNLPTIQLSCFPSNPDLETSSYTFPKIFTFKFEHVLA